MIKECPILLNNSAVTVVRYEKVEVQFPSIHRKEKTVFVKYENGKYEIVEKPVPAKEPETIPKEAIMPEEKEVVIKKSQKKIVKKEVSDDETDVKDVIPEDVIIADAE